MKKQKSIVIGLMVAMISVGTLAACSNDSSETDTEVGAEATEGNTTEATTDEQTDASTDTQANTATSNASTSEEVFATLQALTQEDLNIGDMEMNDFWNTVDDCVDELDDFIEEALKDGSIYFENGYIYDTATGEQIMAEDVYDEEALNGLDPASIELMYLIPYDVTMYEGMSPSDSSVAQGFFVYDMPDSKLMMYNGNPGGILSNEDFESLLDVYDYTDNEIVYYTSDSTEYMDAVYQAAYDMDALDEGVDVRYFAGDGNYAVMLVSPKGISSDIHAYAYKKYPEGYNAIVLDYLNVPDYEEQIAALLPNFNPGLYPPYDVNEYAGDIISNTTYFSKYIDDGELLYGCGVGDLFYQEFDSGNAYVVVADGDEYTKYPVTKISQARTVLEENTPEGEDVPYIILKQY